MDLKTRLPPLLFWLTNITSSFLRHRGLLLASSLCYTTVLSLVPLLAVAFSVAKGFGIYEAPFLREALLRLTAEKTEIVDAILGYIMNTNVKALGFIGVATLFITSVGLLSTMEEAFNIIWHAKTRRGLWSRFTNYVSVILVCPVFILAAFSATAGLESATVVLWLRGITVVDWLMGLGLKAVPTAMVTIALFILYKFLPNVRVRFLPALAGSLLAGLCWQAIQAVYIRYQIGVTGYNAIYGSFAQIPLLLIWLYISWMIVLLGAEIANALQNAVRLRQEEMATVYSVADRRDLMLLLALMLARRAEERQPPLADTEAADLLDAPLPLVDEELRGLCRLGLAVPVRTDKDSEHYALSAPPDSVRIGDLVVGWENLRGLRQDQERGDGLDATKVGDLASRYPELTAIRKQLAGACREGMMQTLRDLAAWDQANDQDAAQSRDNPNGVPG